MRDEALLVDRWYVSFGRLWARGTLAQEMVSSDSQLSWIGRVDERPHKELGVFRHGCRLLLDACG